MKTQARHSDREGSGTVPQLAIPLGSWRPQSPNPTATTDPRLESGGGRALVHARRSKEAVVPQAVARGDAGSVIGDTQPVIPDERRWNHNIHYHPLILSALPEGCRSALDVGCGEGVLTRQLRARVRQVVGIDRDERSIRLAEQSTPARDIHYVTGDVLTHPFVAGSFHAVASVATLHHLDAEAGLLRMADLVAPGGALIVVGLARTRLPRDLHWELAAFAIHRQHARRLGYWEHSAPTAWPPPLTFAQMKRLSATLLPGAAFRRHALGRYSVVWHKLQHCR